MGLRTVPGESLRLLYKWHWDAHHGTPFLTLSFVCPLKLLYIDPKVKKSRPAIRDIVPAPIPPCSFASRSADECIRLWDWRERKDPVYIDAHQHAFIRSLAVGPFVDTELNIIAGLDYGMLFRYDLCVSYPPRGTVSYSPDLGSYRILDRLVAHDTNIQIITWLPPNGERTMNGYIVAGSLRHRQGVLRRVSLVIHSPKRI